MRLRKPKPEKPGTALAVIDKPVLNLRHTAPFGKILISEEPPWRCKMLVTTIPGVYPETYWGAMELSAFKRWRDDVMYEIGSWAHEWGAE